MNNSIKTQKFQSIKGFYDILPEATPLWFKLEDTAACSERIKSKTHSARSVKCG